MTIAVLGRVTINKETANWTYPRDTWEVIPVNPPTFTNTFENILDQGMRGLGFKDFGAFLGSGIGEVSLEGLAHPEQLGYLVAGIIGTVTSVTDPDLNADRWQHTFDPPSNCTIPTWSFEDYLAIGSANKPPQAGSVFRYSGMMCSSFSLKFNSSEGAVGWTASFTGKSGTPAIKQSVPGVSAGAGAGSPPFIGWEGSAHIGFADKRHLGAELDDLGRKFSKLIDYEVTFAREITLEHTCNTTTQPGLALAGPLEVTMKASVDFSHEEDYALYRNNTQQEFGVTISKGTKYISVVCPYVSWIDAPVELDRGGGHVKASWSMRALYNPGTANSPVRVLMRNGTASY